MLRVDDKLLQHFFLECSKDLIIKKVLKLKTYCKNNYK